MDDWLKDVPQEIVEELSELGLEVAVKFCDPAIAVCTNWFIQKENKEKIKKLEQLGWSQRRGRFKNGIKYIRFEKGFASQY